MTRRTPTPAKTKASSQSQSEFDAEWANVMLFAAYGREIYERTKTPYLPGMPSAALSDLASSRLRGLPGSCSTRWIGFSPCAMAGMPTSSAPSGSLSDEAAASSRNIVRR